ERQRTHGQKAGSENSSESSHDAPLSSVPRIPRGVVARRVDWSGRRGALRGFGVAGWSRVLLAAAALRRRRAMIRRAGVSGGSPNMMGMMRAAVIPIGARVRINRPPVVRTRVVRRWRRADPDADAAPEIPAEIGLRDRRRGRNRLAAKGRCGD